MIDLTTPYRVIGILSILLLLSGTSGCSEPEGTAHADGVVIPGVGSSYQTHVSFGDGSSALNEADFEVVVSASDMIVEGKERVVQYVADTMISLICYELGGDISLYMKRGEIAGCILEKTWLRFPFGESQPIQETLTVTRSGLSEESGRCEASWNAKPTGEEPVVVDGKEYTARMASAAFRVGPDEHDSTSRVRQYDVWFVPEIGYVVREEITSLRGGPTTFDTVGVSRRDLRSFSLQ